MKSIQSQIDAIDEQMKATDNQLLLHYLGGQKKRLKVDLLNAARDAADDIRKAFENNPSHLFLIKVDLINKKYDSNAVKLAFESYFIAFSEFYRTAIIHFIL